MKIVRDERELRAAIDEMKSRGRVGFVPTMGALHKGHISLVERCADLCSSVVVSLFVNPTQFNDKNDLKNYPRTEEADCRLLSESGCDLVFIPTVEVIYPQQDDRLFNFGSLESVMEGASRPGHFNGVGQVVSRLFDMVTPDVALFGEKDFQQLAIIRKMTADLGYNIEIIGCPIKRADDGLALSSRNALLSGAERIVSPNIYRVLSEAVARKGEMALSELKAWVTEQINEYEELDVEYFTIVNSTTLQDIDSWSEKCDKRGCIAVRAGNIRLIDNIDFS